VLLPPSRMDRKVRDVGEELWACVLV
jgi:hypothetical protein